MTAEIDQCRQLWTGDRVACQAECDRPQDSGIAAPNPVASTGLPPAIRAGETTKVDMRVRAGVRQRFDIALPENVEKASITVRILRGADVVANTWASREEGKPCTAEVCLEPGDYIVAAKFGDLEGSAKFTVGEREADPVRVEVPQLRK